MDARTYFLYICIEIDVLRLKRHRFPYYVEKNLHKKFVLNKGERRDFVLRDVLNFDSLSFL